MSVESPTVLVVDDDLAVQRLVAAILMSQGYTVLEANRGVQAVQLCRDYPGPINLLLTDILMPNMTGRELALHASSLRPGIRVLYMSGYEAGLLINSLGLNKHVTFLQKPFGPGALLQKVRDALGPMS